MVRETHCERLHTLAPHVLIARTKAELADERHAINVRRRPVTNRRLAPILVRKAHGDEPLQNQAARELREIARLRVHDVTHLTQQHVGDFILRFGCDPTLGVFHRKVHHLLGRRLRIRQRPALQKEPTQIVVFFLVRGRHDAKLSGGVGAGEHAVGHAQAMRDDAVAVRLLDGVGHCMPILEDHAAGLLVSVLFQHRHFGLDAERKQALERRVVHCEFFAGAAMFAVDALLG
mmetsp:Transcript_93227/g.263194  ORF Transcript_93227/g.263194 Transcript_93227/m.263194 type:complete len:232 (+) Transcript_93227:52-747(+)